MTKKFFVFAAAGITAVGLVTFLLRIFTDDVPASLPVSKIGIVTYGDTYQAAVEGFKEGMLDLGWKERADVEYIFVDAEGLLQDAEDAATVLLRERVRAVYTVSTPATVGVAIIKDTPLIFNVVSDPVGAGIVRSLSSSGNNVTGCSNFVGQSGGKRLEMLTEILPDAKNILVLFNPDTRFANDAMVMLRDAASVLGLTLEEKYIHSKEEVVALMRNLSPGAYDVFFDVGDAEVIAVSNEVITAANAIKLPTMTHEKSFVESGMLVSYGSSWRRLGRQCAALMDSVFRGKTPADIPIEIPDQFELTINLGTASSLGITIPQHMLLGADMLIQE